MSKHQNPMSNGEREFYECQCVECGEFFTTLYPDQFVCELCEDEILDIEEMAEKEFLGEAGEEPADDQMNAGPKKYCINCGGIESLDGEDFCEDCLVDTERIDDEPKNNE